jgi:hypothetical protein
MKVKDLSGREHNWTLSGHIPPPNETKPRSELHLQARTLLKTEFPNDLILEELTIPGEQLYLDFYIPRLKIAVEVQGEQHFRYVAHFHGSIASFKRGKINDKRKHEWCIINNIRLVYFAFNETLEAWRLKIRNE